MTSDAVQRAVPTPTGARTKLKRQSIGYDAAIVYLAWILLMFEFDWFLSQFGGGGVLRRIPTFLLPLLWLLTASRWRKEVLYWPYILFLCVNAGHLPFAENSGWLLHDLKNLYQPFFIFLASAAVLRTPRQVSILLPMLMLSLLWYGVQGLRHGLISWHTLLSNEDSYGPLMGIGVGYCYFFAMSVRSKKWRITGLATSAVCVVGVISSFARGAVLSAGLVAAFIWLRSPRKLATALAGVGAAVIIAAAISIVHPPGAFIEEMKTISEGTQEGTGRQRWILWSVCIEVYKRNPVFGVGINNIGYAAQDFLTWDLERGQYADPARLYGLAPHNIYVQLLAEVGTVGSLLWLMLVIGFVRNTRTLRKRGAAQKWSRLTGGAIDLRTLSHGLDAGMLGFLANGFFYNQLNIHWFWTLIAMTYLLRHSLSTPMPPQRPPRPDRGAPSRGAYSEAS